jgi:hypothetical protein
VRWSLRIVRFKLRLRRPVTNSVPLNKPLQRTCSGGAGMGRGRIAKSEALAAAVPNRRTPLNADPLGGARGPEA